jgi:hypothetical protein
VTVFQQAADHGRRWYHLRPKPRRRAVLMGFNSPFWMALVWLIVIVLIVYPFPLWW